MPGHKQGPKVLGANDRVDVPEDVRRRVRAFMAEIGYRKACDRLRVGQATFLAAKELGGRLQKSAIDRLREALDREEPLLAKVAS